MKKLLVLALSAIMVLSIAVVAMAAVTIDGGINMRYEFNKEGDQADGSINFTAKMNDEVTGFIGVKYDTGNMTTWYKADYDPTKTTKQTLTTDKTWLLPWVNEAYVKVKKPYGSFTVGQFEYKVYTINVQDNADSTFGKIKSWMGLNYELPSTWLPKNFRANAAFFRYGKAAATNDVKETFTDNTFALGFGYGVKTWGIDVNYVNIPQPYAGYVNPTPADANLYIPSGDNAELVWTTNAYYAPLDWLTFRIHFGKDQGVHAEKWNTTTLAWDLTGDTQWERIFEVNANIPGTKFYAIFNYNFEDENKIWAKYYPLADLDEHHAYGWRIGYKASNGVTFEWRRKDFKYEYDFTKGLPGTQRANADYLGAQELRVILSFK